MVYKRYIYQNGKKIGPYYYKSVRGEDGKVRSIYVGSKLNSSDKKEGITLHKTFEISVVVFALIALGFVLGFFYVSNITGMGVIQYSLDQFNYNSGGLILGNINLNLNEEDLIPPSSKIVVYLDGVEYSLELQEFILESGGEFNLIEGNYTVGEGFGTGYTGNYNYSVGFNAFDLYAPNKTGDYNFTIYLQYAETNYMLTSGILNVVDVDFTREPDCHKCGQHKAPPAADVLMKVGTSLNGTLRDYYPNSWTMVDTKGGNLGEYNSEYNFIEFLNSNYVEYIINSPQLTTPPTDYEFYTTLNDKQSDYWTIKVSDASTIIDDSITCVATTLASGQTTTCTGQYDNSGNAAGDYVLWLTDDATQITNTCGSNNLYITATDYSGCAACDSSDGYRITANTWDKAQDNQVIIWTVGWCSADATNTITTAGSGGAVTFDATDTIQTLAPLDYPIVDLVGPPNGNISSTSYIDFLFSSSDVSDGISNCSLMIDNKFVLHNYQINGGTANISYGGFREGQTYEWNITCADKGVAVVENTSESRTFTVNLGSSSLNAWGSITDPALLDVHNSIVFYANYTSSDSINISKRGYNDIIVFPANEPLLAGLIGSTAVMGNYLNISSGIYGDEVESIYNYDKSIFNVDLDNDGETDDFWAWFDTDNSGFNNLYAFNERFEQLASISVTPVGQGDRGRMVYGDFNNDTYADEIAVMFNAASETANISVYNLSGVIDSYQFSDYRVIGISKGDFNNDAIEDIVYVGIENSASNNDLKFIPLTLVNYVLTPIWTYTSSALGGNHIAVNNDLVKVVDLNNDGFDDIIASNSKNYLVAVNNSGSLLWAVNIIEEIGPNNANPVSDIIIGDFDNDGVEDDVGVGTFDATPDLIYFFNETGDIIKSYSNADFDNPYYLASADLDNDGIINEIVVSDHNAPYESFIIDKNGNVVYETSWDGRSSWWQVADMDYDGWVDDIIGTYMSFYDGGDQAYITSMDLYNNTNFNFTQRTFLSGIFYSVELDKDYQGCNIWFNDRKTSVVMDYNASDGLYYYTTKGFFPNSLVTYNITCIANEYDLNTIQQTITAAPANNNPTLSNLDLNSTIAAQTNYTDEDLSCNFVPADSDGADTITCSVEWLKNNITQFTFSGEACTKDAMTTFILESENTTKNELWGCQVLVTDSQAGTSGWFNSTQLQIVNRLPNQVLLDIPDNLSILGDRYLDFKWANATDPDEDPLTYQIQVDDDIEFGSPNINVSTIAETTNSSNYTSTTELGIDKNYYWHVRANDNGTGWGDWSEIRMFNLSSMTEITMVVDYIYFGNMTVGDSNNTLDNLPQPFEYQNDGNVKLNITLYADSLYVKQPNPTNNYQFMVSEADEGVSYGIASLTNWNNIPLISLLAIDNLDYVNSSDEAALEVNITIPQDEDPGKKTSVMTFIAVIGE